MTKQASLTKIENCRVCSSKEIIPFLNLEQQPFANALLSNINSEESLYPLELAFCNSCSLVQLQHTADPKELFSQYFWVTGTSSVARKQADIFCQEALARLPDNKITTYALEVASNDGTFLKPFIKKGFDVLGIDPAENIVKKAIADNVPTQQAFFGKAVANNIIKQKKTRPNVVIARNVVPHVANLHDFIEGISCLVGDDGLAIIECHYAKHILQGLQYDSIYHEHLCYFSVKSMAALLKQSGLTIVDISGSPISGGALIVYARRMGAKATNNVQIFLDDEESIGLNTLEAWQDFSKKASKHKLELLDILERETAEGKKIVGYGASARSSTLLNFCNIKPDTLTTIADQNPLKHGTYTAGTRIPILPPVEVMRLNPDIVLVLAWNFQQEIITSLRSEYGFKGKVIIPLPNTPVLQNI